MLDYKVCSSMESFCIGHIAPRFLRDIHNTFTAEGAEYAEFFSSYIHHTFTAENAETAENLFKCNYIGSLI